LTIPMRGAERNEVIELRAGGGRRGGIEKKKKPIAARRQSSRKWPGSPKQRKKAGKFDVRRNVEGGKRNAGRVREFPSHREGDARRRYEIGKRGGLKVKKKTIAVLSERGNVA